MDTIGTKRFTVDHISAIDTIDSFIVRCCYIESLLTTDYPFDLEEQPDAWVQRLLIMETAVPSIIAQLINKTFGKKRICIEASKIYGYPIYLPDMIEMFILEIIDEEIPYKKILISNALDTLRLLKL